MPKPTAITLGCDRSKEVESASQELERARNVMQVEVGRVAHEEQQSVKGALKELQDAERRFHHAMSRMDGKLNACMRTDEGLRKASERVSDAECKRGSVLTAVTREFREEQKRIMLDPSLETHQKASEIRQLSHSMEKTLSKDAEYAGLMQVMQRSLLASRGGEQRPALLAPSNRFAEVGSKVPEERDGEEKLRHTAKGQVGRHKNGVVPSGAQAGGKSAGKKARPICRED